MTCLLDFCTKLKSIWLYLLLECSSARWSCTKLLACGCMQLQSVKFLLLECSIPRWSSTISYQIHTEQGQAYIA